MFLIFPPSFINDATLHIRRRVFESEQSERPRSPDLQIITVTIYYEEHRFLLPSMQATAQQLPGQYGCLISFLVAALFCCVKRWSGWKMGINKDFIIAVHKIYSLNSKLQLYQSNREETATYFTLFILSSCHDGEVTKLCESSFLVTTLSCLYSTLVQLLFIVYTNTQLQAFCFLKASSSPLVDTCVAAPASTVTVQDSCFIKPWAAVA